MRLLPDSLSDDLFDEIPEQETPQPAKTWKLDIAGGRIGRYIDEMDAFHQFAEKAIRTARSRYLIYTDAYGSELDELIGDDVTPAYMDAEIPRMVREALIYDDRVESVEDIQYRRDGDRLYIEFVAVTIYGDVRTEVVT